MLRNASTASPHQKIPGPPLLLLPRLNLLLQGCLTRLGLLPGPPLLDALAIGRQDMGRVIAHRVSPFPGPLGASPAGVPDPTTQYGANNTGQPQIVATHIGDAPAALGPIQELIRQPGLLNRQAMLWPEMPHRVACGQILRLPRLALGVRGQPWRTRYTAPAAGLALGLLVRV